MGELPTAGGGSGKRFSKRQIRELQKKQLRSYNRGDEIQEISKEYHSKEEEIADEQLHKELEALSETQEAKETDFNLN